MGFWNRLSPLQRALGAGAAGIALIAIVALAVVLVSGGGSEANADPEPQETATPSATATRTPRPATASPTPILYSGLIDGVPMSAAEWEARKDRPVIALMIDNHPAAWPHSGLDKADMVVEAFVEGTVTRYMAVFWRNDVEYIEPVRSARTPYIIWASELDALYGHAGEATTPGPACATCQLSEWGIKDMDAFSGVPSNAYYRDGSRFAPHNLVTGTSAIIDAGSLMGWNLPPTVQRWLFSDAEEAADTPEVGAIEIDFGDPSTAWHVTQWHWDKDTNTYLRFAMGGPHVDGQTGEQLRFKNVVVMRVPWAVADSAGHVTYEQIGAGPVTIYRDGKAIEGEWRKPDRLARTRFYDADGKEIPLNRGPVWIAMIGPNERVLTGLTAADLPPMPFFTPGPDFYGDGGFEEPEEPQPTEPPVTSVPTTAPPTEGPTSEPTVAPTVEPPTEVPTVPADTPTP